VSNQFPENCRRFCTRLALGSGYKGGEGFISNLVPFRMELATHPNLPVGNLVGLFAKADDVVAGHAFSLLYP
jgi:hypothetical protein